MEKALGFREYGLGLRVSFKDTRFNLNTGPVVWAKSMFAGMDQTRPADKQSVYRDPLPKSRACPTYSPP